MEYTKNYNLKKPSEEDFYNVNDFNSNSEIVDTELKKLDQIIKTLQDGINAAELLKKIKEVDGAGSGLDADTVDGLNTGYHPTNTFIPTVYGSVLEIGKYIDFHEIGSPKDFDGRLSVNNNYPYWQPDGAGLSKIALADSTLQTNLNADLLNGKKGDKYFSDIGVITDIRDLNNKFGFGYCTPSVLNMPKSGHWFVEIKFIDTNSRLIEATGLFLNERYFCIYTSGVWKEWIKIGGGSTLFTVPRQFDVRNATAGQTVFSYNGGSGVVITTTFSSNQPIFVIDGVELNYISQFPFSSSSPSSGVSLNLQFKNSIIIKTRSSEPVCFGIVMTEK